MFDPKKVRESVPILDQLQALQKVVDQGKVRYYFKRSAYAYHILLAIFAEYLTPKAYNCDDILLG